MSSFVRLEALHEARRDGSRVMFVHAGQEITWSQLLADTAALRAHIEASPVTDWAVFDEQAYPFTVALLALLGSGRRLWLPASATPETAARLARHCQGWLGTRWPRGEAIPTGRDYPAEALTPLNGEIVVFTSGSTGEPKAIPKQLHQLDNEVSTLESLWGELLGEARMLGTVSHQHIYGLLFRVLWPLCAGRISDSRMFPSASALLETAAGLERAVWISSPAHLRRLDSTLPWRAARPALAAIFSSGGPLSADSAQRCHDLGKLWPIEVFGSSESGGIAWRTQAGGNALWTPLPGIEIGTADDGRLQLRSPHLPDRQWLTMDDAVNQSEDGRFTLGPRLDRIVKVEGKRLSLPELETRLAAHEWLSEARALLLSRRRETVAVVAIPTDSGREQLARLGRHVFARRLREWLQPHFEAVTLPRLWRFVEQLPLNAQGKLSQQALVKLFERREIPALPPARILHQDGEQAEVQLEILHQLACFRGHFPGLPVVPGMVLTGWAEYHARQCLTVAGEFRQLRKLKFRRLVRPGQTLRLRLTYNQTRASVQWRFTNEPDGMECASGELVFG